MRFKPHDYQQAAIDHIVNNPDVWEAGGAGLLLDMGLGKTIITLTALSQLVRAGRAKRILIIAPVRVAHTTWPNEIKKWDHLSNLSFTVIKGTPQQRKRALAARSTIHLIGKELTSWIVSQGKGKRWPYDVVVVDELSAFKNHDSERFKALRMVLPFTKLRLGLTGTPAPNGLLDLWSQVFVLDRGVRLGKTFTGYRDKYFTPTKYIRGEIKTDYRIVPEASTSLGKLLGEDINEAEIHDKIRDICISMQAKDYLKLPRLVTNYIDVELPAPVQKAYRKFEQDSVLQLLESGEEITAMTAGALAMKLAQFANGAVYDEDKKPQPVHDEKLEALAELLEEAAGNPVLCFYQFRSDIARIEKKLARYKPHLLRKGKAGDEDLRLWNEGKVPFLLAHAASAGHGLNMQEGGHILAWFGLPRSLELYQQAIARLHRQGQTKPVFNHVLTCPDTVEVDVIRSLDRKANGQNALLEAVKARIREIAAQNNRRINWGR